MKWYYCLIALLLICLIAQLPILVAQESEQEDEEEQEEEEIKRTEKQEMACNSGPLDTFSRQEWQKKRKELEKFSPKAGEDAPDFVLSDIDGKNEVHLLEAAKEKPIVLIFGSYT